MKPPYMQSFDPEMIATVIACTLEAWTDGEVDLIFAFDTIFAAIVDEADMDQEILKAALNQIKVEADLDNEPMSGVWN